MKPVFNLPMLARGAEYLLGVSLQAGDQIATLGLGFSVYAARLFLGLGDEALRFNERHALQAWPSVFIHQASTSNVDGPAASRFHSPVTAINVGVIRSKVQGQPAFEQPLDVGPKPSLIVLEPEHTGRPHSL